MLTWQSPGLPHRQTRAKEPWLGLRFGFAHFDKATRWNLAQLLRDSAGPDDLDLPRFARRAQAEAYEALARRRVTDAGRGMVVKNAAVGERDFDARTDSVAITLRSPEFEGKPVVLIRRYIAEQEGFGADGANDDIDSAVVVKIGESGAPMERRRLEVSSGGGRNVFKSASRVAEDTVWPMGWVRPDNGRFRESARWRRTGP